MSVLKERFTEFDTIEIYNRMVTFKEMGNIYEIDYCSRPNTVPQILKLDKNHYVDLKTGEVKACNHISNRSESAFQVGQSLKRLRDLINTNVIDTDYCKWLTLTYRENMQDTKKLYKDFQKFMQRLRYHFPNNNIEYITACEPQGRGAWHIHAILIFDKKIPFIPNDTFWKLWSPKGYQEYLDGKKGYDFVKTKALKNIDNVGAYLTAYLGDMEFNKENIELLSNKGYNVPLSKVKYVDSIEGQMLKEPKKIIKGGRLYFYPPNFNLYRASRGIKKPKVDKIPYYDAKKRVGSLKPIYTSCINITDTDNNFSNKYYYEYYNKVRENFK